MRDDPHRRPSGASDETVAAVGRVTEADGRPHRHPLPRVVERAVGTFFGTVAAARHRRALHPLGIGLRGRAVLHDAGAGLARARETDVEARLSRGVGLPHPLPDFNGVALRFLDAHGPSRHQDLLLVAAGSRPGLRHLIVPMPYLTSSGYSTVLPHRTPAGDASRLPVRPAADPDGRGGLERPPADHRRADRLPARRVGTGGDRRAHLGAAVRRPAAVRSLEHRPGAGSRGRVEPTRAPAYAGSRAATPPDRT